MKKPSRLDVSRAKSKAYYVFSFAVVVIFAILFAFPLYWIITGAFKTKSDILSTTPVWWPSEWVGDNFAKLMNSRSVPLFELTIGRFKIAGPTIPAAIRWLLNTVVMAVGSPA